MTDGQKVLVDACVAEGVPCFTETFVQLVSWCLEPERKPAEALGGLGMRCGTPPPTLPARRMSPRLLWTRARRGS
jgi:hypothetical protein